MENIHPGADLLDHANTLVTQDSAGRTTRDIALEDMQVGAADRGLDDLLRWRP
jgi:hypothetical protein